MTRVLTQVRQAVTSLNPREVREQADRALDIGVFATDENFFRELERFLLPATLSVEKRREAARDVRRGRPDDPPFAIEIYQLGTVRSKHGVYFDPARPHQLVKEILEAHPELNLALARSFPPFREEVCKRVTHAVARENALFSIATAIPNIAPLLGLGWAVGEFASDAAVLTANQIRLAFLLAAASDRPVGYGEQKGEVASIIAGAFGWRAIARELVGKIPLGGGLIPKAAVAYAGTFVLGQSLNKLYQRGYGFTRAERKSAYSDAFDRGKAIVSAVVEKVTRRGAA